MQICCVLLYTTFFEADFSLFLTGSELRLTIDKWGWLGYTRYG